MFSSSRKETRSPVGAYVETELKFLHLKNKIFGILESLLYQNLYKTKNFPYLTNLKYTWDLFSEKEWLRTKSMHTPNTFSNNILKEPQW
jgi:hypothetical protein